MSLPVEVIDITPPAIINPAKVAEVGDLFALADSMLPTVEMIEVVDEPSAALADECLASIKGVLARIDQLKERTLAPAESYARRLRDWFRVKSASVVSANDLVRGKLKGYQDKLMREAQERVHREAEEREAERKRVLAEAQAKEPDNPAAGIQEAANAGLFEPVKPPVAPPPIQTSTGTLSSRRNLRVRVLDILQVPERYLEVKEALAKSDYRANGKPIPGLEFFYDSSPVHRGKKDKEVLDVRGQVRGREIGQAQV